MSMSDSKISFIMNLNISTNEPTHGQKFVSSSSILKGRVSKDLTDVTLTKTLLLHKREVMRHRNKRH